MSAYHTLFNGTGVHFSNTGNCVGRDQFSDGYCLMAFNLTPVLSASETAYWNLVRNVNVHLEIGFDARLTETLNCLVYAKFENVIEIDRYHNVAMDLSVSAS